VRRFLSVFPIGRHYTTKRCPSHSLSLLGGSPIFAGTAAPSRQPARISKTPMVRVPATASLLRAFQPRSSDSFHSVYSGLRPIYATQSHPQTLNPAHIQSLRDAKLRSGSGSPNARSCLENRERSFHLSRNENHHFTLCLQGCGRFHARKIGEPPTLLTRPRAPAASPCFPTRRRSQ
jgi:hypothetical protein